MGWFSWSSDSSKASDGGRIAPDRTSRQKCWEGRDRFFACLDNNDIIDSVKGDKEARKKCAKEIAEFESACSAAWVWMTLLAFPEELLRPRAWRRRFPQFN